MNESTIGQVQMEFYRKHKAGCAFAAFVAKDPLKYGWMQEVIEAKHDAIESEIQKAINVDGIATLSLIFPEITN